MVISLVNSCQRSLICLILSYYHKRKSILPISFLLLTGLSRETPSLQDHGSRFYVWKYNLATSVSTGWSSSALMHSRQSLARYPGFGEHDQTFHLVSKLGIPCTCCSVQFLFHFSWTTVVPCTVRQLHDPLVKPLGLTEIWTSHHWTVVLLIIPEYLFFLLPGRYMV